VHGLHFIGQRVSFYPGVTELTPNHMFIIRAEIAIVKAKKGFIPNQSVQIRFAAGLVNGIQVLYTLGRIFSFSQRKDFISC
jgi:hypothetical protein